MQSLPDDDGHEPRPGRTLGDNARPGVLVELERAQCLDLLGEHRVGRFAVVDRDDLPFVEVFQGGSTSDNVVLGVPTVDIDTLVLIGAAFFSFDDSRAFFAVS